MSKYRFRYIPEGGGRPPSMEVLAQSDSEAYGKIAKFLAEKPGRQLMMGTIKVTETRYLPDPPHPTATNGTKKKADIVVDRFGTAC